MKRYSLSHLSDEVLLRDLATVVAQERTATAEVLAHIAEVDARQLYRPAAYPSMFAYCVGALHLSEDAAFRRITAARAARRFPAIFGALAEGRLSLTAIGLLGPYLTEGTAAELLAAASHKSRAEIEQLVAARFPRTDMLAWVAASPASRPAPGGEDASSPGGQLVPERVGEHARVTRLAAERVAVQFTMSRKGHDDLRYVQALLGHRAPSPDLARVFERALKALIAQLEKQKFAATARPRHGHGRPTTGTRHVPAHVRRAVWERDQGRCTFVSDDGHRCPAESDLEFDHVLAVARGGEATVEGIRLLCRAHNQYAAERTFGAGFMRHQRIAAAEKRAAASERAAATRNRASEAKQRHVAKSNDNDVVPWLRALGFNAAEARRASECCADMPEASLEDRVRLALTCFRSRGARVERGTALAAPA